MTVITAPTEHETAPTIRPTRTTAIWVGVLFLAATATFLVADALVVSVLDRADPLASAPANATALSTGAVLAFVTGLSIVGIALLLHPLLKRHSERLALGYVGFRVAESAAILLYVATPLLAINLGDGLVAGAVDASPAQHLGALLQAQHHVAIVMIYLFTSVAGTVLCVALHRSRLIPRLLTDLGLVGYPVLLAAAVLHIFGLTDVTQGAGLLAVVPGGLFELILPIWLLTKGFTPSGGTR